MNSDLYKKLVDMYAGHELPAELEDEMELAAFNNPALSHDMSTLRKTVDMLRADRGPAFTEESNQRILMKMLARSGVEMERQASDPQHIQYQLPMQG